MVEEQTHPLADTSTIANPKPYRNTKTRCCAKFKVCSLVTLILFVIIVIILAFTIFNIKDPTMTLNKISLNLRTNPARGPVFRPGTNVSITADVSVKNPNQFTFKFGNTTSNIYYKGIMVGEAYGPSGHARPLRTVRMNVIGDIITERIMKAPNLSSVISSGILNLDSFTRIPGRIKLLKVIDKIAIVEMNCTVSFNITSQEIQGQNCKRHVTL